MTFKHIDFFDSPTMRELVRQDLIKEKAKAASEGSVVKTASAQPEVPVDLVTKINKLAEGLRSKGFKKEAEELETNLINYKVAETHLYKVFEEDGEDLINFAHPGKGVDFGGAEGHGVVDNILAAHKKILDIVNKEPKATKEASEKKKITKEAQEVDFSVPGIDLTDHKLNRSDLKSLTTPHDVKMFIMHGEDLIRKYENGINVQLRASEDFKDQDYFDESAKALKLSHLLTARKETVEHNVAVLNGILNEMRAAGEKRLEQAKDLPTDTGEGKMLPYSKWVWWRDNVAGKVSRLLPYLTDEAKDSFKVVFDALKGAKSYPEALNNFPDKMKFYSNINKLDSVVMQWEDFIKKQAALNVVLKKDAQFAPPTAAPKAAPAANIGPNNDPGPDYVGPAKAPAAPATKPAPKRTLSKAEFDAVTDMQRGLNNLVDVFKSKGFKISKEDEAALTATGFGSGVDQRQTADAVDGRWGDNTSKALAVANKVLKENGIDSIAFETKSPFSSGKRVISDDYSKVALDNLNKIKELSAANGVVLTEDGGVTETTFDEYYEFKKDDFNSFESLFNKLRVFEDWEPSKDPDDGELGWSLAKWRNLFQFLGERARNSKSKEYQDALRGLFIKFRNSIGAASVDSSGEQLALISPGALDGSTPVHLDEMPQQMLAQKEPGYKGREHSSGEGTDFEDAENKQKVQPFAKSVSSKILEQYYHPRNIHTYRSLIPFLSYETLFTQPAILVRQFAKAVPWNQVLSYFNLNPSGQAMVNGKTFTDFSGRPVSWAELDNIDTAQTSGFVEAMKTKASVLSVNKALKALHQDMLEAKNEFIESGVPSQVAEGMERHYANWARAFDAAERNLNNYYKELKI